MTPWEAEKEHKKQFGKYTDKQFAELIAEMEAMIEEYRNRPKGENL